jgi:hypothetical protein
MDQRSAKKTRDTKGHKREKLFKNRTTTTNLTQQQQQQQQQQQRREKAFVY